VISRVNDAKRTVRQSIGRFRPVSLVVVLLATLALAACGVDDEDDPTPVPTAAAPVATSPAPSAVTPAPGGSTPAVPGATPAGGSPAASATTTTVGRLAEGIAAAWPRTTYRRVQTSVPSPSATPNAGMTSLTITDEVAYPGSVHRTVADPSGATSVEFLLIDGQLFARGSLIASAFQTGTSAETWVQFSQEMLAPGSTGANVLSQLQALFEPRYSGLAPEELAREAVLTEETTVGGQSCFVYSTVETTPTGERLDVEIALTSEGRLCSVTTTGGGLDVVETFEFDVPLTITAPESVGTPAASPEAATPEATPPATPAA
jgi:hypothetical protein